MQIELTKLRGAAVAALMATTFPALATQQVQAQDGAPDLTGTWSGNGTGGVVFGDLGHQAAAPEPSFKDLTVTWTLGIERQEGTGLVGTWSDGADPPNKTERLIGVLRGDNKTVLFVDEDTYFNGTILSENEMEVCLQETGGGSMVATCYVLKRQ